MVEMLWLKKLPRLRLKPSYRPLLATISNSTTIKAVMYAFYCDKDLNLGYKRALDVKTKSLKPKVFNFDSFASSILL